MKVIDIINGSKPSQSLEVFPPKTSGTFESSGSNIPARFRFSEILK